MTSRRDDADEIRRMLENRLESLLDRFYPGFVVRKGKAYLTPKNQKDLGSFTVNLNGPRRGQWYRFSQEVGGGTIELISYALTNGTTAYAQAFREARAFLGLRESEPETEEQHQRREQIRRQEAERRARAEREEAQRKARRAETANEIFDRAKPIAGTLGEQYLLARGIPVPPMGWPDALRFAPSLVYEMDEARPLLPAIIARVDDVCGDLTAVWRIYLSATATKANVPNAKLGLGPSAGGAVRIGGMAPTIGICEGVETALGFWSLINYRHPVWAALSTSGMAGFEAPIGVERIRIVPDGDKACRRRNGEYIPDIPPGRKAAHALRDRLIKLGIAHTLESEPAPETDYLDVWNSMKSLGAPC